MDVMEQGWFIYHQYFINKWKRSLRIKQQCFPKRYNFESILAQRSLRAMTELLVERYSEFRSLDEYLEGYSIVGDVLAHLSVPSHILVSLDDPIIPARDLQLLASNPNLEVISIPHGGHCGFMDAFNRESWADRQAARLMGLEAPGSERRAAGLIEPSAG
jgi:predicted alpha/beta-fold hydrolase